MDMSFKYSFATEAADMRIRTSRGARQEDARAQAPEVPLLPSHLSAEMNRV